MALVDEIYKNTCKDILTNGSSTEGQEVRPIWPDTKEKAFTLKRFGVCNRYDLRKEFPLLTLRKINIKGCMKEILWIYQKKSNHVQDLGLHIWDEWTDEHGSIGKAYGYQIAEEYVHHIEKGESSGIFHKRQQPICMNQMDAVLYDLKHTPYSRRIMTNMYNFKDLHEMKLYPCAYSTTWNVTDEGYDKPVLNMMLNQRSLDFLTAGNWNVAQYALLMMMVAREVDMIPGELVHMIADCHIYDRHVEIIEDLINEEGLEAPTVTLNPEKKLFSEFTEDDLIVDNYNWVKDIKNIPVAV